MVLLLVSISACSCSSASACLKRCTVIWLQFSRASGRYSFHHLPILPAWNRKLATTLLAPMLLASMKLGWTCHCFGYLTWFCFTSTLISECSYKLMRTNKAQATSSGIIVPMFEEIHELLSILTRSQSAYLWWDAEARHLSEDHGHRSTLCYPTQRNTYLLNVLYPPSRAWFYCKGGHNRVIWLSYTSTDHLVDGLSSSSCWFGLSGVMPTNRHIC